MYRLISNQPILITLTVFFALGAVFLIGRGDNNSNDATHPEGEHVEGDAHDDDDDKDGAHTEGDDHAEGEHDKP